MQKMKPPLYSRMKSKASSPLMKSVDESCRHDGSDAGGVANNGGTNGTGNAPSMAAAMGDGYVGASHERYESLLQSAQRFSAFAIRHVEEARRELSSSAAPSSEEAADNRNGGNNGNGGSGGRFANLSADDDLDPELASAFQQLTAAYDRLSILQWDAARRAYEETCRGVFRAEPEVEATDTDPHYLGLDLRLSGHASQEGRQPPRLRASSGGRAKHSRSTSDGASQSVQLNAAVLGADKLEISGNNTVAGTRATDVDSWFAAAFHDVPFSSDVAPVASLPNPFGFDVSAQPSSLAPSSPPFNPREHGSHQPMPPSATLSPSWTAAAAVPPPGFEGKVKEDSKCDAEQQKHTKDADNDVYANDSSKTGTNKETTQSTSVASSSDISSLAHPEASCSDRDSESGSSNSSSSRSSSSSSTEEDSPIVTAPLPRMENIDYVYKGGYATRVSDGKESHGVVPRTARHVTVDPAVSMIEEGAFHGCSRLESIVIHASVISLGDHSFRKCSALKSVIFLSGSTTNGRKKEKKESKKSTDKSAKSNTIDAKGIRRQSSRGLNEPATTASQLRSIGDWAFFNCSSLSVLSLPRGIEHIGTRSFQRCSSLSNVYLPNSLKSVGENAFHGCPREAKAAFEQWENERRNN